MGKMQRTKGANFERLVAKMFAKVLPSTKRGIGQARSASEVPDVDAPGWWVECKHGAKPNWRAAYAQACDAAQDSGRTPIVVSRDNGGVIMAHLPLDVFLRVLEDGQAAGRLATAMEALDVVARAPVGAPILGVSRHAAAVLRVLRGEKGET